MPAPAQGQRQDHHYGAFSYQSKHCFGLIRLLLPVVGQFEFS
jgi:hypothetical protein